MQVRSRSGPVQVQVQVWSKSGPGQVRFIFNSLELDSEVGRLVTVLMYMVIFLIIVCGLLSKALRQFDHV